MKYSKIDLVNKNMQYGLRLSVVVSSVWKMNFKREAKDIYKNDEKLDLAKTAEKYKRHYDEELEKNRGKTKYDFKRIEHVTMKQYWLSFILNPFKTLIKVTVRMSATNFENFKKKKFHLSSLFILSKNSTHSVYSTRPVYFSWAKNSSHRVYSSRPVYSRLESMKILAIGCMIIILFITKKATAKLRIDSRIYCRSSCYQLTKRNYQQGSRNNSEDSSAE